MVELTDEFVNAPVNMLGELTKLIVQDIKQIIVRSKMVKYRFATFLGGVGFISNKWTNI